MRPCTAVNQARNTLKELLAYGSLLIRFVPGSTPAHGIFRYRSIQEAHHEAEAWLHANAKRIGDVRRL
jgi:hypothetical protein